MESGVGEMWAGKGDGMTSKAIANPYFCRQVPSRCHRRWTHAKLFAACRYENKKKIKNKKNKKNKIEREANVRPSTPKRQSANVYEMLEK